MSYNQLTTNKAITVYDVFYDIVEKMKVDPTLPKHVTFSFGYWENIANEMVSGGRTTKLNEFDRYPIIFLHADFKERKHESVEVLTEINPKIYLLERTKPTNTFKDRQTDVFVKTLNPLYDLLLKKMDEGRYFSSDGKEKDGMFPHDKKDLYYIGSLDKSGSVLNEFVDAIELSFSKLKIKNNLKL